MNETEALIHQRKRAFLALLSKDSGLRNFILGAGIALVLALLSFLGVFTITALHFVLLACAFGLGALLWHYGKTRAAWYPLVAWIVWIAIYIRTRNLPGLRDITTGDWTLGPDLDPFLFLRWAKYIVLHGSIMAHDVFRYVPLGFDTPGELLLTPYLIAWFYKVTAAFGLVSSVTQAAVFYPVFMFACTVVAFFLLVRIVLKDELGPHYANVTAVIASLFLTIFPALLPRTIAGIPEKESGAFLFMFLSFYFFIAAWKSATTTKRVIFSLLAGISTGCMGLTWGGEIFIFLSIGPAFFIAFVIGKVSWKEILSYSIWIGSAFLIMHQFSSRYSFEELLSAVDTGSAAAVLFIALVHQALFSTTIHQRLQLSRFARVPKEIVSTIIGILLAIVGSSLIFGLRFIPGLISGILKNLITPSANRLLLTVAENKQPYFTEWAGSFGPFFATIPLTFWMFCIASLYWFFSATKSLHKKDRIMLTASYAIFLFALIFSRYSADGLFNGTNTISIALYVIGFLVFVGTAGYLLFSYHRRNESHLFHTLSFEFILAFVFFFMSVVAARAALRTIMVLVPSAALLIGYLIVRPLTRKSSGQEKNTTRLIVVGVIILASFFAAYQLYQASEGTAGSYFPTVYNQQWQKAMAWVRENTPPTAVFGHWWDYGYWVQSIGERATVLDGGNAISYWNHLMGRYALTGNDEQAALEFLYAHNTTHFLIDSTDIGKYSAFASIGSNASYDRSSYIPTFYLDQTQVQERKNSSVLPYMGGIGLDEDIIFDVNGTRVFLPQGRAGIRGILIEQDKNGTILSAPQAVFVDNGNQQMIPLRYAYVENTLIDFKEGLDAGVFIYPRVIQSGQQISIDKRGALLYLSRRTIHTQFTRLYLFNQPSESFKLVHSEDDYIVNEAKKQVPTLGSFIDYNGVRGPLRIWEIHYPSNITYKPEFVSTDYPAELIKQ